MKISRAALSWLLVALAGCGGGAPSGTGGDAGGTDTGELDTGLPDVTVMDTGAPDPGVPETAPTDVRGELAPEAGGRCFSHRECAAGELARYCDPTRGVCVACLASEPGSCPAGQYCTGENRCAPGCATDRDCVAMAGMARCHGTLRVCVECAEDGHCPAGRVCGTAGTCVPGCSARQACPAGMACCSGVCREVQSDVMACGTCGTICAGAVNAAPACMAGRCRLQCEAGFADCDGTATTGCEASLEGTLNCGRCGNACGGATPLCGRAGGTVACVSGCDPSSRRCGGSCVDVQSDVSHCGECGAACPAGAQATRVCREGRCALVCQAGFGDCDGNAASGCETDTLTAAAHCGGCGRRCPTGAHAAAICVMGRCGITCDAGFADCDGNPATGCEAELAADPMRCGTCTTACPGAVNAAPACVMGRCRVMCEPGFADCDASSSNGCEADTRVNVGHCGGCGTPCAAAPGTLASCVAGRCTRSCVPGAGDCDGDAANGCEVDLNDNRAHCGGCGRACGTGQVCAGGTCGRCLRDEQCPAGQRCNAGVCTAFACDVGTGADGDFRATGNRTLEARRYNYRSFVIDPGATVTVTGSAALVIRVTGEVTVAGALVLDGQAPPDLTTTTPACSGSVPGPTGAGAGGGGGGSPGGTGGPCYSGGGMGGGTGGGQGGTGQGGGGGGGGHAVAGGSASPMGCATDGSGGSGGRAYGDTLLSTLAGGSGGGGGSAHTGCNSGGAGGGGGGGALVITAPRIVVAAGARISANGGNGGSVRGTFPGSSCLLDGGSGGGGSGGTIWLQAGELVLDGAVQARAGEGGRAPGCSDGSSTGMNGAAGSAGRIRLDVGTRRGAGTIEPAPGLVTPGC